MQIWTSSGGDCGWTVNSVCFRWALMGVEAFIEFGMWFRIWRNIKCGLFSNFEGSILSKKAATQATLCHDSYIDMMIFKPKEKRFAL